MAEYDRIQKKQESRAIANNSLPIMNIKTVIDNRLCSLQFKKNNVIQLEEGETYDGVVEEQPASGTLKIHITDDVKWGKFPWYDIPSKQIQELAAGDKVRLIEDSSHGYRVEIVEKASTVPAQPEVLPPDLSSEIDTTKVKKINILSSVKLDASHFYKEREPGYLINYIKEKKHTIRSIYNSDKKEYIYSILIGEGTLSEPKRGQILFNFDVKKDTIDVFHAHEKGGTMG